jgi:phage tail-like protein
MPLSTAFSLATGLTGRRLDPYMAFNFVVEIEGLLVGGFSEVRGLESEIEVTPYREGGLNSFEHKLPGPVTTANLVLVHGLTDIDTLWNWYDNVCKGIIKRKNGTILLLDRQQTPVMWWDFRNAYPVKWMGPQLDAGTATAVAVEQVELAHEGLKKPLIGKALAGIRAGLQLGRVL